MTTIDEIVENFTLLDQWDDRYRYVIELGRTLPPLPEGAHSEANKVRGCASQVWLLTHVKPDGAAGPMLTFDGDSDAHIVRGLIAILLALYSGKRAQEILDTDALALFDRIRLARRPDAAALERPALDGRAHPRRSQSGARAGLTSTRGYRFLCVASDWGAARCKDAFSHLSDCFRRAVGRRAWGRHRPRLQQTFSCQRFRRL